MLGGWTQHPDSLDTWLRGGALKCPLGQWGSWQLGVQEAAGSSEASGLGSRWLGPDEGLRKRTPAGGA